MLIRLTKVITTGRFLPGNKGGDRRGGLPRRERNAIPEKVEPLRLFSWLITVEITERVNMGNEVDIDHYFPV